ncbi:hypothetical protein ACHAXT_005289 [Thalassiosira profunda]
MALLHQQCRHVNGIPFSQTLLYCLGLSSFFVLSLYAFVPPSVRRLPRDYVLHIKWRAGVIVGVMLLGVGMYPWLFCDNSLDDSGGGAFPQWYRYIGCSWQPMQDGKVALHVLALYLGSLSCTWLKIYHNARHLHWEKEKSHGSGVESSRMTSQYQKGRLPFIPKPKYLLQSLQYTWIQPTAQSFNSLRDDEEHRWTKIRNLGLAPLAEEVVFRACLLPPLLASETANGRALSPTQASWIAPLFFGVAHIHHFYEQYRHLPPQLRTKKRIGQLLLGVVVQWAYTTLFGAYVSHVFVRTASLGAATVAHVICNYMGLPDISFAHPTSNLYGYRWLIAAIYFVGIGLFARGFDSDLFPRESVLPLLLQESA